MTALQQGNSSRIVIHLGVQKTGSTSLHHFLTRNEAALADLGLTVRMPNKGSPMRPMGRAAIAYSLAPSDETRRSFLDAVAKVRDNLPQTASNILISHENLAGAMPGNGGETRLFPVLPQILPLLDEAFAPVLPEYVVYSRAMDQWKASVWAQAVRTDGYAQSYDEFLNETRMLPDWPNLIARLEAAVPGRLHHLRLEDEADSGRPGVQLLRLSGLTDEMIASLMPLSSHGMQRLNPGATEFLRRLNNLTLNPHARTKVADLVARAQHLFNADHRPEGTP